MDFGNLYQYFTKNGIVIPQTSSVRSKIETAYKEIFGDANLDTTAETFAGRQIEAFTMLCKAIIEINALNANNFNPTQAIGSALDNLAAIFGTSRPSGSSDAVFRKLLIGSGSRGSGFPQAIRNELSKVSGVTSVTVLENGHAYPVVLPNSESGITVDPHSVYICVGGGTDADVARAIFNSKSGGCGYTNATGYGTKVTQTVVDGSSENTVIFYRPQTKDVSVSVVVNASTYTGIDIAEDTESAVRSLFAANPSGVTITDSMVASAIASSGSGIICTGVVMTPGDTDDSVKALPYQMFSVTSVSVTVA